MFGDGEIFSSISKSPLPILVQMLDTINAQLFVNTILPFSLSNATSLLSFLSSSYPLNFFLSLFFHPPLLSLLTFPFFPDSLPSSFPAISSLLLTLPILSLPPTLSFSSFRVVDMDVDRGVVELRNIKAADTDPRKTFTFDAVYDWKWVMLFSYLMCLLWWFCTFVIYICDLF